MKRLNSFFFILLIVCLVFSGQIFAEMTLDQLTENQSLHGFKTISLYDNANDQPMGARFVSEKYGFIVDYLQIESVPQAFFWVKTPPTSSKGEPHACEHLLLGKGNRGRYVAALEDMALSNSTAYTAQTRTCYHFNTVADGDAFYDVFEAKLQALLHPDFTDEEIRREVCHIGVLEDPETGELFIDEKGTVYTEMVSSFEKPWYYTYSALNNMVYGDAHPLTFNSGGHPDVMRSMTAQDMWDFHDATHHLNNMGAIVSMSPQIPLETFLTEMNALLERCNDNPRVTQEASIRVQGLPPADMAPAGSVKMVTYPSENAEDPGYMLYAWPATVQLNENDKFMLDLFLDVFAGGSTSNLYNLFINSATRQIDVGGNYVYGGFDDDLDLSIYFGLTGVNNKAVTKENLDQVRDMIVAEFDKIKNYADGSEELIMFNERVKNRLIESKKRYENNLNSPPMFGFRGGPAGRWVGLLLDREKQPGFRKSLVLKDKFAFAEKLLSGDSNFWKGYIDSWQVLDTSPYMVGASPDPSMLKKAAEAKDQRIATYIKGFEQEYGVLDVQHAIAKYKETFDAKTAELEAMRSKAKLPDFVDNPPMTLDEQLQYSTMTLPGNIPLMYSTFENMSSSTIALSLSMDVIPEKGLVYLPLLPEILTEVGVIKDGVPVPYDQMREQLRKEVMGLYAGYDFGFERERSELTITGQASNTEELKRVVSWMQTALFSPYLDESNLSRLKDLVNQNLIGYRNRMKGSEESWVNNPANAYRFQENPLYLATSSFLTQTHYMQRLKWMLTDIENEQEKSKLKNFMEVLGTVGSQDITRETFVEYLNQIENGDITERSLADAYAELSESTKKIVADFVKDMKSMINGIPDKNLHDDRRYLCYQAYTDISRPAVDALTDMNSLLALLRKADIARMTLVSNSNDRTEAMRSIEAFAGRLDNSTPSTKQTYSSQQRIIDNLRSRVENLDKPVYTGLLFDGTRNGVLIFQAPNCNEYDTTKEALLTGLSSKLFTGYGPHGLFMKTWAAGLAYSNGYRFNEKNGWARYYAERCPDVAETMRFVVNELKNAEYDPGLVDYAVAQVFGDSRAPSRYESRGMAMADDLVDGFSPDKVKAYRQHMLALRQDPKLYDKIRQRMEDAYGSVLIGYGKPLEDVKDGVYFLIGPEQQFQSLEQYIKQTEGEQTIYRLYPRDYWMTN